jgi:hypothetical protein
MTELAERAARLGVDLARVTAEHDAINKRLQQEWTRVNPQSEATVVEFVVRATGNAKRKLLRRWPTELETRPGAIVYRAATSFEFLTAHSVEQALNAIECGGKLEPWRLVADPLRE